MYSATSGSTGLPWMFGSIPFQQQQQQQQQQSSPAPIHFAIRTVPSSPPSSGFSHGHGSPGGVGTHRQSDLAAILSATMAAAASHAAPAMMGHHHHHHHHHHHSEWRPLLLVPSSPSSSSSSTFASPVSSPTSTVSAAARFTKSRHLDTWVSATPIPGAASVPMPLSLPQMPIPKPEPMFLQPNAIHDARQRAEIRQQQRSAAVLHQQELLQQAQQEKPSKRRNSQQARRDSRTEPTPMSISPPKEDPSILHMHHHHVHVHVATADAPVASSNKTGSRATPASTVPRHPWPDAAPMVAVPTEPRGAVRVASAPAALPGFLDPNHLFHGVRDDAAVDADSSPLGTSSSQDWREVGKALDSFSAVMMDVASDGGSSNDGTPSGSGSDNDEEDWDLSKLARDDRRSKLAMSLLSSTASADELFAGVDIQHVSSSASSVSSSLSAFMGASVCDEHEQEQQLDDREDDHKRQTRPARGRKHHDKPPKASLSSACSGTRNQTLQSAGSKWLESTWKWPRRHDQQTAALTRSAHAIWQNLCTLDKGPGSVKGLDETMCIVCYMALLSNNCPWLPSEFADYVSSIAVSSTRPFKKGVTWMRMLKAWQSKLAMPELSLSDLTLQRLMWWFKSDDDRKTAARWVTALQKSGYFDIMNTNSAGIANHGSISSRMASAAPQVDAGEEGEGDVKSSAKSRKKSQAPRSQNIHFFVRKWLVPALMVLKFMDDTRGSRKALKDILPKPLDRLMEAYQVKPYVIQQQCSKLLAGVVSQFACMVQLRKEEMVRGLSG